MVLTLQTIGDTEFRGEGRAKADIQDYMAVLNVKTPEEKSVCFQLCRDGSQAWASKSGRSKCSEPEPAAQEQQRMEFE